eukprot:TRINITY_DN12340_c0_g1_i1.p1 TRINITY_DN12340_c0_g1~~TRINITY_DN12340_c0_g1_i1.p1  ORF type:complete len:334 (-),score=30.48 TRINITY_DN12340_c0_g1_i1:113-1114(-)
MVLHLTWMFLAFHISASVRLEAGEHVDLAVDAPVKVANPLSDDNREFETYMKQHETTEYMKEYGVGLVISAASSGLVDPEAASWIMNAVWNVKDWPKIRARLMESVGKAGNALSRVLKAPKSDIEKCQIKKDQVWLAFGIMKVTEVGAGVVLGVLLTPPVGAAASVAMSALHKLAKAKAEISCERLQQQIVADEAHQQARTKQEKREDWVQHKAVKLHPTDQDIDPTLFIHGCYYLTQTYKKSPSQPRSVQLANTVCVKALKDMVLQDRPLPEMEQQIKHWWGGEEWRKLLARKGISPLVHCEDIELSIRYAACDACGGECEYCDVESRVRDN